MVTEVEKAPRLPKKTEQSQQKAKFVLKDLIEVLKNAFKGVQGKMDVRYLWTDDGVHRFRVNWWMNSMIQQSKFVHMIEENEKFTVRSSDDR